MTPTTWASLVTAVLAFVGVIGAAYLSARNSLTGKLLEENRALHRETAERTDKLQERLNQMEITITSLRQENLQSTSELLTVRRDNTDLHATNQRLTEHNDTLTRENEQVRQINKELQESVLAVERHNSAMQREMTELQARNQQVEGQMQVLRRRIEQLGGSGDLIG